MLKHIADEIGRVGKFKMLKHIADEIRRLPDCDFHRGVTSLARALGAAYLQGLFSTGTAHKHPSDTE
ncbi:MAG: hypothetical protein JRF45_08975 [Deltaproteobacteria bacterium]|nr:hypothetical protein [Deltaproteobacteria bacterium]